ncbi:Ribosomal L29 protein [Candidatus Rhabdochlamydia oedothoracis]|uniref:Large ribosomal subunit protein uL29 n=1 Tax=Candidatus Rhabdochlamydia oedothoracis TaxID=2720720 RepID=A0ABX8UZA4_9BACT|nr:MULTISPECIES: 50S ribosomal protein L29 [Rhabdochlamydia]KAG6559502.1 50S ribosomal protein L29 [Candidatus Rhabdochlamydia sp. W815]MCL6756546.1 50S ribosomal protein L29 [Candidatus Rhabdochlamydia oedothoracis]QYF48298.1 Ribosomal L29 protein [Candidatus Rhabdochlamydia oedothoracis]
MPKKAKELRDQSKEELQALYADLSKEIFELRNELKTTRKLEKPHLIRLKKRDRARVLTVLQEKKA